MTRKMSTVIAVCLLLVSFLTACSSKPIEEEIIFEHEHEVSGLICISEQENFIQGYTYKQFVLYDPQTMVMYTMITGKGTATLSVLYNADGTLKLYQE